MNNAQQQHCSKYCRNSVLSAVTLDINRLFWIRRWWQRHEHDAYQLCFSALPPIPLATPCILYAICQIPLLFPWLNRRAYLMHIVYLVHRRGRVWCWNLQQKHRWYVVLHLVHVPNIAPLFGMYDGPHVYILLCTCPSSKISLSSSRSVTSYDHLPSRTSAVCVFSRALGLSHRKMDGPDIHI